MSAPELSAEQRAEVERFGIHTPDRAESAVRSMAGAFIEIVPSVQSFIAAIGQLVAALESMLSPRARRRLRKKAKLVAHYQAKLNRIPSWKRERS